MGENLEASVIHSRAKVVHTIENTKEGNHEPSKGSKPRKQAGEKPKYIKQRKGEMQPELEEGSMAKIVIKYSKKAFIGKFSGKEMAMKALQEWVSTTWWKSLGYTSKFHLGSRGFTIFLFKSMKDRDKITLTMLLVCISEIGSSVLTTFGNILQDVNMDKTPHYPLNTGSMILKRIGQVRVLPQNWREIIGNGKKLQWSRST